MGAGIGAVHPMRRQINRKGFVTQALELIDHRRPAGTA